MSHKPDILFVDNGLKLLRFSSVQSITRKCFFFSPPTRPPLQVNGAGAGVAGERVRAAALFVNRIVRFPSFFPLPFLLVFGRAARASFCSLGQLRDAICAGRPVVDRPSYSRRRCRHCREPCQIHAAENREVIHSLGHENTSRTMNPHDRREFVLLAVIALVNARIQVTKE